MTDALTSLTLPHPELPLRVDSTMLNAFRACPRQFYYEYVLGLRPKRKSIDLHFGGCIASSLETFYRGIFERGLTTNDALKESLGRLVAAWGTFPVESVSVKTLDRAFEAITNYVAHYPPLTDHVQPYRDQNGQPTIEYTFAIPLSEDTLDSPSPWPTHPVLGEPFIYCGRFDLLGEYLGRPCVRDEKTSSKGGFSWAERWDLRAQLIGYVWACQQNALPVDTAVVRGIIIRKYDIEQMEAIKIYPTHLIQKWEFQTFRDLHRMVECWNNGWWDYNFGDSCTAYSGCAHRLLCLSETPEKWFADFTISRWDPLSRTGGQSPTQIEENL